MHCVIYVSEILIFEFSLCLDPRIYVNVFSQK